MDTDKSLDKLLELIAATLHDIQDTNGAVFNSRARRLTFNKIERRARAEGVGFLTKTLPRLGKGFDKSLSGGPVLNATDYGLKPMIGSKLPRFLGELFSAVFQPDGAVLPHPNVDCVRAIRQLLLCLNKYELPYNNEQEQQVIQAFKKAEDDLATSDNNLIQIGREKLSRYSHPSHRWPKKPSSLGELVHTARILLSSLFAGFDPKDIDPSHGPGVVATKQRLWDKYNWTNVSAKITEQFPLDAYFYASLGHVCDRIDKFSLVSEEDLSAKVLLVPKDSRGPRLISCEPVDFQWIQQGIRRSIVATVEHNELTKFNIFFSDQQPNRIAALYASETGKYATLDLKEASDRVSVELVRLLWPQHLCDAMFACRSSSTVMPNGEKLMLRKFAPMGSSLCFPVMAITIWAILAAGSPDADARESIHVYGDDVIVKATQVVDAIEQLESFGLQVNRDKSCTSGFFRESCGMDAFKGIEVTPVRFRTVWSSTPSPESYSSWIAYANDCYDRGYLSVYEKIVEWLHQLYGEIPSEDMDIESSPSLRWVPKEKRPKRRRIHPKGYQTLQWYVWCVKSPSITKEVDGWMMLLRYFTEHANHLNRQPVEAKMQDCPLKYSDAFLVRQYTRRDTSMLVKRWR